MQARGNSSFKPSLNISSPTKFDNFDSQSSMSDYFLQPDYSFFRQKDYYFLFDNNLKFSKRVGFCIDDNIDIKDYLKMRLINRKNLTKFLKRIRRNQHTEQVDWDYYDSQSTEKDYDDSNVEEVAEMTDEQIDSQYKLLLKERRNG